MSDKKISPFGAQILRFGRGQSAGHPAMDMQDLIRIATEAGGDGFHIEGNQLVITATNALGQTYEIERRELVTVT